MKSSYDIIIWIFIFLLIALIIGLYTSEKTRIPKSLYMRTNGASTPYIEHFEQDSFVGGYRSSSSFDVSGGASSKYGWGINENNYERNNLSIKEEKQNVKKEEVKCIQKKDDPMCTKEYIKESWKSVCNNCDILQHPDINKYVLKSSVPACPNIDLNNYIKKSEIPACPPKVDLNNYIKKSEIPSCPTINKCPTCPELPKPKAIKSTQNTYQFNILDIKNLKNEDIKMLLKDERIKNYLDSEYEEKNNIPKRNDEIQNVQNVQNNIVSYSEESSSSNNNYSTSSSLWNEISSLFGFSNNKSSITSSTSSSKSKSLEEEELKSNLSNSLSNSSINKNISEEEYNVVINKNNSIIANAAVLKYNKSLEEEEHKMIYNKNCTNNFLKPHESNASGLYAGDSLYASV
jgi:hypothetical protein